MAMATVCVPGHAESVYRCVEPGGKVSYLDSPCANVGNTGKESVLQLRANPIPIIDNRVKMASLSTKPKVAEIRLFYDPTNAPVEHPLAQMEMMLRNAAFAWASNCNVHLIYVGTAPAPEVGRIEKVGVRWAEEYIHAQHPAFAGAGIAGTGSLTSGVRLSTRMTDAYLPHVLVHEIGHVLGLPHNHEDSHSVMSYLPDKATPNLVQPSPGDYRDCNLSMKHRFGIDVDVAAPTNPPTQRMTDRQALERIYRPASAPKQ